MIQHGIRILDEVDSVVSVQFSDILDEIIDGNSFFWSILYLDAIAIKGEGKSFPGQSISAFEKQILKSENGYSIDWNDIILLSKKLNQVIDITLIGCKDISSLKRYDEDCDMYEACDFVIKMIDSSFWEVFSKEQNLLTKLKAKFKQVEPLTSDFEP